MNTTDALLAAVAADPWDDTPRLVYADHLDDQDDAASRDRAEFVRTQVESSRLESERAASGKSGWRTLKVRSRAEAIRRHTDELLSNNLADWLTPIGDSPLGSAGPFQCNTVRLLFGGGGRDLVFARGFPSTLTLPLAILLADPARVGRVVGLTGVVLGDREPGDGPMGQRFVAGVLGWYCHLSGNIIEPDDLPSEIWDRLVGGEARGSYRRWVAYATRGAALAALNAAALDFARTAAGLPPLTPAGPVG